MPSLRTHDPEVALQVSTDQIYQLYQQTWRGLAGTLFVAAMDVVALWTVIDHHKLLVWLGAMVLLTLARMLFSVMFHRSQPAGEAVYRWANFHVAGATCSALIWGAPAIFLWPVGHPIHQLVWPICIVAISASAVATYSTWPLSYLPFLMISVPAISLRLLVGGDLTYIILGILGIVFCGILGQAGRMMHAASVKTLEVSLRNKVLNDQLRLEIDERQKSQRQLVEANLKAEEASKAKSVFLANMSHEIRTPLNGVIGTALLLKSSALDSDQKLYVDTLETSSTSLLAIIEDILDFSKIEAGRIELDTIDFDLHEVIDDVVDIMSPKVREKELELVCSMPYTLPTRLIGDPGRLRQILLNLVGNGVKFTHDGAIEITVECRQRTEDRALFAFSVKDSGIGVPKELQASLFESFTQADISTTRQYGGTGLGLAISKALVELIGGEIGIKSTGDGGATLWFTGWFNMQLPVEETAAPPAGGGDNRLHVLLIDDSAACRTMLAARIIERGGAVLETGTIEAAITHLSQPDQEEYGPDAIFFDENLAEDLAATRDLFSRLAMDFPRAQVVQMQPLGPPRTTVDQQLWSFAARLRKPLRPGELHTLLEQLFSGRPLSDLQGATSDPDGSRQTRSRHGRILLAEDNHINQLVITRMLHSMGYERVDAVDNGIQAIAALKKHSYSLVLMDIQMPQLDGMETTRRIRNGTAGLQNAALPVIALTANAIKGDRERYLACGMNGYITKPVDPNLLRSTLQQFLDAATPDRRQEADPEPLPSTSDKSIPPPLLDFDALVDKLGDDQEFARRIVDEFMTLFPLEIDAMAALVKEGNECSTISQLAHKLKGMTASVCAERLAQRFGMIEQAAINGDIGAVKRIFEDTLRCTDELPVNAPSLHHPR